jgi:hypothetical protein
VPTPAESSGRSLHNLLDSRRADDWGISDCRNASHTITKTANRCRRKEVMWRVEYA